MHVYSISSGGMLRAMLFENENELRVKVISAKLYPALNCRRNGVPLSGGNRIYKARTHVRD